MDVLTGILMKGIAKNAFHKFKDCILPCLQDKAQADHNTLP